MNDNLLNKKSLHNSPPLKKSSAITAVSAMMQNGAGMFRSRPDYVQKSTKSSPSSVDLANIYIFGGMFMLPCCCQAVSGTCSYRVCAN